ncbi:MAG: M20/M25/M40 family metallo-hydrolase [Candidatus Moraniibacteriota bacterium]
MRHLAIRPETVAYVITVHNHLHTHPETRWEETKTLSYIKQQIGFLGIKGSLSELQGGLTFDYVVNPNLAWVLFRADIDALPILEHVENVPRSENDGVMHACGHDINTAVLLGLMKEIADDYVLPTKNIRFVFQRAEENPGASPQAKSGGASLVEAGICDGMSAAYMLHTWAEGTPGAFSSRPGAMLGCSDRMGIILSLEEGRDPKTIMQALQTIWNTLEGFPNRTIGPIEPATLEPVKGRKASNVMPDKVWLWYAINPFAFLPQGLENIRKIVIAAFPETKLEFFRENDSIVVSVESTGGHVALPQKGTNALRASRFVMNTIDMLGYSVSMKPISYSCDTDKDMGKSNVLEAWYGVRTMLSAKRRDEYFVELERVVVSVVSAFPGVGVRIEKILGHPALINTDFEKIAGVLKTAGENVEKADPSLGGEDFAYYLQKIPGSSWLLCTHREGSGHLHTATFNPDPEIFAEKGVRFWTLLATEP